MKLIAGLCAATALVLVACSPEAPKAAEAAPAAPPPPVMPTEAEAIALVEKIPTGLMANDIAGLMTIYTDDAVLVDSGTNDIITTKDANKTATENFAKAGFTKLMTNSYKVQVVDANTFIVTSVVSGEMMQNKKPMTIYMRVTDVAHKGADGKWLIINEHASAMPQPVKTPIPVVKEFKAPAAAPATPAPADAKPATPPKPN